MVTDRGGRLAMESSIAGTKSVRYLRLNPRSAQLCWWAVTAKVRLVPSLTFCRITSPKIAQRETLRIFASSKTTDEQTVAQERNWSQLAPCNAKFPLLLRFWIGCLGQGNSCASFLRYTLGQLPNRFRP